jgi:hypothetical protein
LSNIRWSPSRFQCLDDHLQEGIPVDSAGLKIYGEGERLDQRHAVRPRRRWRKLHLGVDANNHEIVAVELTRDDVGDVAAVPDLLDQIDGSIASMTGDRAHDGQAAYDAVAERHPEPAVVIPPRSTAAPSATTATQRDQRFHTIAKHGRISRQRLSGYSRRSRVETAISRYKAIPGRLLHARTLPNQKTRAKIACNVLNRMTSLGMPVSVRIK